MHEIGITRKIMEDAQKECEKRNIKPTQITVEVGSFSGHDAEEIEECYEALKKDFECLQEAKIEVKKVPGRIQCSKCGKETSTDDSCGIVCEHCDSTDVKIKEGKDIKIVEISKD